METARGSVEVREPTKLEQTTARRVAESKATVPHIYVDAEVDVTGTLASLAADGGGNDPTLADLAVKAAATALRERPRLNSAYRDGRFELYSRVNVGITVPAQESFVVPTIFDTDTKEVGDIAAEARALEAAARDGALTSRQLAGGTFTLASVGAHAVARFTPVINGGQAGVLALGGVADAAVVHDGEVIPGKVVNATLACDHRIVDGDEAAGFLDRIKRLLEEI